jgi:TAP-like protein
MTLDAWLSAAEGDASGLWFDSLAGDLLFPTMFICGEYMAVGQPDRQAAREYFASGAPGGLAGAATTFAWGGGRATEAWPTILDEQLYTQPRTSTVDTLLIGGELDFSTPPANATKDLLPYLPNGHQAVRAESGHSGSFWADQPEAGRRLVNTFLDSGKVDDSGYRPVGVDFTPPVTQATIAKGLVGTMVGLGLLTLLSLLWMVQHGRFGRTASVLLRSLYPAVLGVGGWSPGALLVLATMPGVRLNDEVLTAVSVGVPVGLGIYLAWVNRRHGTIGVAAAVGGALVGGWLGFHAVDGILALITTIAGAIAGANLLLLVLDIMWQRPVPDPGVVEYDMAIPVA